MSLYQVSKLLFQLNRDDALKSRFKADPAAAIAEWPLSDEEREAVLKPDIGLLFVLGVNGQILMHYAALCGIEWSDYLRRMRDGLKEHGPVRGGIGPVTTDADEKIAGA